MEYLNHQTVGTIIVLESGPERQVSSPFCDLLVLWCCTNLIILDFKIFFLMYLMWIAISISGFVLRVKHVQSCKPSSMLINKCSVLSLSFPKLFSFCGFCHKLAYVCAKSLQSCPTLCNPVDYSLPVSSVSGILQTRILEWDAMPSSRGSYPLLMDQTCIFYVSCSGRWVLYH